MSVSTSNNSGGIFRPPFDTLYDGTFEMTVLAAKTVSDQVNLLPLLGRFQSKEGEVLETHVNVFTDWDPSRPFRQLLELGHCLPEPRQQLDTDKLVGLKFKVTIKMKTKDGKVYPNITRVELPSEH